MALLMCGCVIGSRKASEEDEVEAERESVKGRRLWLEYKTVQAYVETLLRRSRMYSGAIFSVPWSMIFDMRA